MTQHPPPDNSQPEQTRPLRVLHVVTIMDCGGIETRLVELMRHIDRSKYQFDICVHKNRPGHYDDEVAALGGKIIRCGPLRNLPVFAWRFYQLLRHSNYDVVHSHVPTFSAVCMTIARLARIKRRIAHFRTTRDVNKDSLAYRLYRRTLATITRTFSTDVIGISRDVLRTWFGANWHKSPKTHLVYNGLNLAPFCCQREPDWLKQEFRVPDIWRTIVHVGRFAPPKNHAKLVEIAEVFLRQDQQTCFLLIGEGELEAETRNAVQAKGLNEWFRFVGLRSDVPRIMKAADTLLFPSKWEGLGNAVIEGVAAGLPMVLSDLPAFREIIQLAGKATFIGLDQPNKEWAAALARALDGPRQDDRLAELQQSTFTLENHWINLLAIYNG